MSALAFQFSAISRNAKTGPIPVTMTAAQSCPESCGFRGNGCYAESGNLAILWRALSAAAPGTAFRSGVTTMQALSLEQLCARIAALPAGQLWRHNQAGDLPGLGLTIDAPALAAIVKANKGKRGFTYSHKPPTGPNLAAIRAALKGGFVINLSADSAGQAARLKARNPDLPVVCVLPPETAHERIVETDGHKITVCPATRLNPDGTEAVSGMTCARCGLCANAARHAIVGFPAHGARLKAAANVARAA